MLNYYLFYFIKLFRKRNILIFINNTNNTNDIVILEKNLWYKHKHIKKKKVISLWFPNTLLCNLLYLNKNFLSSFWYNNNDINDLFTIYNMHKEFMYTKMQETKHLCFLIQNTVYSTKPIVFTRKILSIQMPLLYKLYMIHINYMYTYHIQNILYILSYTK